MKDIIKKGEVSVYAKHRFTPEEKEAIAQRLAERIDEKSSHEDELQSLKSSFKAKIDSATADINKLSTQYKDGYEYQNQKAILTLNFKTKEREYAHPETGEVLKTEPLYESDYQKDLIDEAKKK